MCLFPKKEKKRDKNRKGNSVIELRGIYVSSESSIGHLIIYIGPPHPTPLPYVKTPLFLGFLPSINYKTELLRSCSF